MMGGGWFLPFPPALTMFPFPFMPQIMPSGPGSMFNAFPGQSNVPFSAMGLSTEAQKWILENQKQQIIQLRRNIDEFEKTVDEALAKVDEELSKAETTRAKK